MKKTSAYRVVATLLSTVLAGCAVGANDGDALDQARSGASAAAPESPPSGEANPTPDPVSEASDAGFATTGSENDARRIVVGPADNSPVPVPWNHLLRAHTFVIDHGNQGNEGTPPVAREPSRSAAPGE